MSLSMFELLEQNNQQLQIKKLLACNEKTGKYNLVLTQEEAAQLMVQRKETLKKEQRVEFGEGILQKIIETFCDSQYIYQSNYVEILTELQEIFYLYKNESMDCLTDDELLEFMKEQFEEICFGSTEYLSETCLERFSRAIRAGYRGYTSGKKYDEYGGYSENEYTKFSEEIHWDRNLYLEALMNLND